MLVSKSVRCEQCGYENDGRYRFCGMCGAKLPAPEPIVAARPEEPPARQEPVRPVSGPSFLGLADESASNNVSYLLEDEVSSSHRGRILVLLLFIGIGVGAWHWRNDWRVLLARAASVANGQANAQPANNNVNTANNNAAPAPTSASPSEVAPAMGTNGQPAAEKPMTGVGEQPSNPPATSGDNKPASASGTPAGPSKAGDNSAASAGAQTSAQKDEASNSTAPKSGKATSSSSSDSDDEVATAKTPARPQKPSAEQKNVADTSSTGDALEVEGEKYLYGSGGVPANCARAQRSLVEAANQASAKADTVLGTMYATGHCTARDLPLAYRWFAKALDQEPGNARYQRDLEVLWNQMNPDERKTAMQRQ